MDRLGVTGDEFHIIHVAGTNGKGTVSSCLASILTESGKRTGLFTSPHLIEINERICIDRKPVSDEEFLNAFHMVQKAAEELVNSDESYPTFFEFIFAMAMVIFKSNAVEYVVLETGLGGRLDATNIFEHPDLSVITSVGMDHMQYLGDTLEQIAEEKAGIIKPNVPVVCDASKEVVWQVLRKKASEKHSKIVPMLKKEWKEYEKKEKTIDFSFVSSYGLGQEKTRHHITLRTIAPYQVQNTAIVLRALEQLDLVASEEMVQRGIWLGQLSGRMQEVFDGFYIDGAHNEPGMKAFLEAAAGQKGKKRLLFSAMRDKNVNRMIELIETADCFEDIVVTTLPYERGMKAEEIAAGFTSVTNVYVEDDFSEAVRRIREPFEGTSYCAGSLYLAGEVMKKCRETGS